MNVSAEAGTEHNPRVQLLCSSLVPRRVFCAPFLANALGLGSERSMERPRTGLVIIRVHIASLRSALEDTCNQTSNLCSMGGVYSDISSSL